MNNKTHENYSEKEPVSVERILTALRDTLPAVAQDLIASSHNMSDPLEQRFRDSPDSPAEHSPRWHQYGILTHSEKFRMFLKVNVPKLMEGWGIKNKTAAVLSEEIDGVPKADLLQITALLHDLGKFTARTFESKEDGSVNARFVGHEAHSGVIIRTTFSDTLRELGLSEAQIEYVAQCAEHHFDLGKAREIVKDTVGYTMEFATSESFEKVAKDIINACPEYALEIGLMFMADSDSKTEVAATSSTDEGIASQRKRLQQEIQDKDLDPLLIDQALQQPVNTEIGRRYLLVWASMQ